MINKHIVLVSSGQPSANPRLVKEAIACVESGFRVTVIYCPLSPWADQLDKKLFSDFSEINWVCVGFHPILHPWLHRYVRIRRKIFEWLNNYFSNAIFACYSLVLFGQELKKAALSYEADLFIGHNLGALPVVVLAAKKWNAKAGFDAEDFHRGEAEKGSLHWKTCQKIEDEFIPQLDYLSAASPLIEIRYRELYPEIGHYFILRNVFDFPKKINSNFSNSKSSLQIFWFSQFIGHKRGIELLIEAMAYLPKLKVCLNLLGNINSSVKAELLATVQRFGLDEDVICFHPIMPQDDLIQLASQFDIGLAGELSWCESRDLCETNKIFIYLLAGLAIAFSDTKAQSRFLKENPGVGVLFNQGDAIGLANCLLEYLNTPELLQKHKQRSLQLAKQNFNWNLEKNKFLEGLFKALS